MSRNFYQAKNYTWERTHGTITCLDHNRHPLESPFLFSIYDEGGDDNLINAYMAGVEAGRKQGRREVQDAIKHNLGIF